MTPDLGLKAASSWPSVRSRQTDLGQTVALTFSPDPWHTPTPLISISLGKVQGRGMAALIEISLKGAAIPAAARDQDTNTHTHTSL